MSRWMILLVIINMLINKEYFWDENYYNHPPLTVDAVVAAETLLSCKLPALLLELLKIQNGGYTLGFAFPMTQRTSWANNHVPLIELFGIVENPLISTAQNILDSLYLIAEWGLPEKQVLLAGDGHWWITLDYRAGENPTVKWLDTEMKEEIEVANSFEEFINGLIPLDRYAN